MSSVKVFVSARDRVIQTAACIKSLRATEGRKIDIWLFDAGTTERQPDTLNYYSHSMCARDLDLVVMARPEAIKHAYWSKNFMWAQFLQMVAMLPEEERRYLVMVDNDVVAHAPWLQQSIELLRERNISVVSPYDGAPVYETVQRTRIGRYLVEIRKRMVSRFWVAPYEWWCSIEPPSWHPVQREGKTDRMPTDAYYYQQMERRGQFFAVFKPPVVSDPDKSWPSARMKNNIGADCRR